MSYRKIEVGGQVFEYSIGRTHTKIRGVGVYENDMIGNHRTGTEDGFNPFSAWSSFQVRPSDLASFIKHNQLKVKNGNKRV